MEPETTKIYPTVPDLETWSDYTINDLKNKLSKTRLKDFENDLLYLDEKIKHYKKLFKRWKNFDVGIRWVDITMGTIVGLSSGACLIITTMGTVIPIIAISTITSIPVVYTMFHGILNISLLKKKLVKYQEIVHYLEETKNKLFLFHQKALQDDVLTDAEIATSKEMIKQLKVWLNNKKTDKEEIVDKKYLLDQINKLKLEIKKSN